MTTITVAIFHNVARDQHDRHTGMHAGYQPSDPMVRVFAYQTDPAGRIPEKIAEEAITPSATATPRDARGEDLAEQYYQRRLRWDCKNNLTDPLRSLSSPGNRPCCPRSCCTRRSVVWLSLDAETEGPKKAGSWRAREHVVSLLDWGGKMSRLRQDAVGRVYGIGGLMTVGDDQGRTIPAIEGRLDKDGRRVLLRIEPTGWERQRYVTSRRQPERCACW